MGKLKRITLTIADKQIIRDLLGKPGGKMNIEVAKQVREVRRRFDIRSFEKISEKIGRDLNGFGISFNSWDDLLDIASVTKLIDEKTVAEKEAIESDPADTEKQTDADNRDAERLAKLRVAVLKYAEDIVYTIDDVYLAWLRDIMTGRDWSKISIPSREGGMKEVVVDVHPGQFEALADFDDKLMVIISGPSIEEERSLKKKEN